MTSFQLGSAFGRIDIDTSGVKTAVDDASKQVGGFEGVMQRAGQSLTGLGKNLTLKLGAPLAAIGVVASKAAIDFESSFAGVRKTVNASEAEYAKLRDSIQGMATSLTNATSALPDAQNQLAGIMEMGGQLGVSTESLSLFTDTIAKLTMATSLTAESAATELARFANVTQMPMENIDRLGSVVVALGNKMATTEPEIVAMAQRLAAAGSIVGMSEADIMAMAAAFSSVGIQAEAGGSAISKTMFMIDEAVRTAGTGVVNNTGRIATAQEDLVLLNDKLAKAQEKYAKATTEAEKIAAQRVIDSTQAKIGAMAEQIGWMEQSHGKMAQFGSAEMRKLAEVAGMTTDEFAKLWKGDSAQAMTSFIEGLGRMKDEGVNVAAVLDELGLSDTRMKNALLSAAGAGDLLAESLGISREAWEANNALNTEAEARFATTEAQINLFKNTIRGLAIVVGDALLPALNDGLRVVTPLIQKFAAWFKTFAENNPALTRFAALLGLLVVKAGPLLVVAGKIAGFLAALNPAFLVLAAALLAVNRVLAGLFEKNVAGVADRFEGLRYTAGILGKNLSTLREALAHLGRAFKTLFKTTGGQNAVTKKLGKALGGLFDRLRSGMIVANRVILAVSKLADAFATFMELMRKPFDMGGFQKVRDQVEGLVKLPGFKLLFGEDVDADRVMNMFRTWERGLHTFRDAFYVTKNLVGDLLAGESIDAGGLADALGAIPGLFDALGWADYTEAGEAIEREGLAPLANYIKDRLLEFMGKIDLSGVASTIGAKLGDAFNSLVTFDFGGLVSRVWTALKNAFTGGEPTFEDRAADLSAALRVLAGVDKDYSALFREQFARIASQAWNAFKDAFSTAFAGGGEAPTEAMALSSGFQFPLPDAGPAAGSIAGIAQTIKQQIEDDFAGLILDLSIVVEKIKTALLTKMQEVDLTEFASAVGTKIGDALNTLVTFDFGGLATQVWDSIKSAFTGEETAEDKMLEALGLKHSFAERLRTEFTRIASEAWTAFKDAFSTAFAGGGVVEAPTEAMALSSEFQLPDTGLAPGSMAGLAQSIRYELENALTNITLPDLGPVIEKIKTALLTKMQEIDLTEFASTVGTKIGDALNTLVTFDFGGLATQVWDAIKSAFTGEETAEDKMLEALGLKHSFSQRLQTEFSRIASEAWTAFKDAFSAAFAGGGVVEAPTEAMALSSEFQLPDTGLAPGSMAGLAQSIKYELENALAGLTEITLPDLSPVIGKIKTSLLTKMQETDLADFASTVGTKIGDALNTLVTFDFGALATQVWDAIKSAFTGEETAEDKMLEALGLKHSFSAQFQTKFTRIAGEAWSAFQGAFSTAFGGGHTAKEMALVSPELLYQLPGADTGADGSMAGLAQSIKDRVGSAIDKLNLDEHAATLKGKLAALFDKISLGGEGEEGGEGGPKIDLEKFKTSLATSFQEVDMANVQTAIENNLSNIIKLGVTAVGALLGGPTGIAIGLGKLLVSAVESDFLGIGTALEASGILPALRSAFEPLIREIEQLLSGIFGGGIEAPTEAMALSSGFQLQLPDADQMAPGGLSQLQGFIDGIKRILDTIGTVITEDTLKGLGDLGVGIQGFFDNLAQGVGAGEVAGIGDLVDALSKIVSPIIRLGGAVTGGILSGIGAALPEVGTAFSGFATAIAGIGGGDANMFLDGVAQSVTGLANAFLKFTAGIANHLIEAVESITGLDLPAAEEIPGILGGVVDSIRIVLTGAVSTIGQEFGRIFDSIKLGVLGMIRDVVKAVGDMKLPGVDVSGTLADLDAQIADLSTRTSAGYQLGTTLANNVMAGFAATGQIDPSTVTDALAGAFEQGGPAAMQAFYANAMGYDPPQEVADRMAARMKILLGEELKTIAETQDQEAAQAYIDGLSQAGVDASVLEGAIQVSGAGGEGEAALTVPAPRLEVAPDDLKTQASELAGQIDQSVIDAFNEAAASGDDAALQTARQNLLDALFALEGTETMMAQAKQLGQDGIDAVLDGISLGLSEQINTQSIPWLDLVDQWETDLKTAAGIASPASKFVPYGTSILEGIAQGVTEAETTLSTSLTTALTNAETALAGIASKFLTVGESIIEGIRQGVENKIDRLTTQVETAAQAALEAAEGALDIASPSGAFMRIGENVVAGMVQGLQHGQPMLAAAIAGMTTPPPVGAASAAGTRAAPAVQDNRTYTYQDYWQPQYAERPSPDQQWHDANLWKLHKRRR